MTQYLLSGLLILVCLQGLAQQATNEQFDALAQKYPVVTYKTGEYKVEEVIYPSQRTLYGHGFVMDSLGNAKDVETEEQWDERMVATRVDGEIITSSMLEEHIENNEYPTAFFAIPKVHALENGRLLFLVFNSDQGISGGMCGAASSFRFGLTAFPKKEGRLLDPVFICSYGSCTGGTVFMLNGADSLLDVVPDSVYWQGDEFVLACNPDYESADGPRSVKYILSFREDKNDAIRVSLRKEDE
jgi:hypothetical protein